MRERILVTPDVLAREPAGSTLVLDVSVALAPARFDGDFRVGSGRPGWVRRRVPGSVHLDLLAEFADADRGVHFGRPSRAAVLDGLARLGVGDRRLVVHDDGRMQWAARAWWMLRCAGVESRVLDGGLAAWEAAGRPVEEGEPADGGSPGEPPAGGGWPGEPPPAGRGVDGWADLDEVVAISTGERPGTLICALSPEQFAGRAPSRYARRGHIPGSRNLPAAELLGPDHTLLPDDEVREAARALDEAASPIVVYCGGGISACVTALGLTLAGRRDVAVYDGSLEEWTADPALPVVTSPPTVKERSPMPATGQMHLAAFVTAGPGRPGGWRYPESVADWRSAAYYQHIGQTLERGKFDLAFFPDILAVPDTYGGSTDPQLRYGGLGSMRLDPIPVIATIAAATERLGVAATVSTTYSEPFALARSFATLDHLSGGRAAWNIVTSFQHAEARNHTASDHIDRAHRYRRAEEYVQVAAQLWDSWDDDALVVDRAAPVFADPGRVHAIAHHGEYFDVEGPLNVPRPPQGYPVLIQAGGSPAGRDFAARWADVVFCSASSKESARDFRRDIRDRAAAHGRNPNDVKVLPAITPVVADTDAAAHDKAAALSDLAVPEAGLSTLSYHLGIDLATFPHDERLPDVDAPGVQGHYDEVRELTERHGMTLRELGRNYTGTHEGDFTGTPGAIADTLEEWFADGAGDGFTVAAVHQPAAFEEFVDAVVPELQRRGLFREQYAGETLRDHIGVSRPAAGAWRSRAALP